ncbi:hypothetical protein DY245_00240, partial [Streptomyces inhibens]
GGVAAVLGCRAVVVAGGVAAVDCGGRPAARGGREPGCREARSSGCSDTASVVAVRGGPTVSGSGAPAAWAWLVDGLFCSAVTVRPPPTRAKAVAAMARRRCFFHRASCRRRAARPCPVGAVVSSKLPAASAPGSSATASAEAPLPIAGASER